MFVLIYLLYLQIFLFTLDKPIVYSKTLQVLTYLHIENRLEHNWWTIPLRDARKRIKYSLKTTRKPRRKVDALWLRFGKAVLMQMMLNLTAILMAVLFINAYAPLMQMQGIASSNVKWIMVTGPCCTKFREFISHGIKLFRENCVRQLNYVFTYGYGRYAIPYEKHISFEETRAQYSIESCTPKTHTNTLYKDKVQIYVKLPNQETVSIFPKVGTEVSDIFLHPKLKEFDKENFFLKTNISTKLISEEHRITTIHLIPKMRGGSGDGDDAKEELMKDLIKKDKENMELINKIKILEDKISHFFSKEKEEEEEEVNINITLSDEDDWIDDTPKHKIVVSPAKNINSPKSFSHKYDKISPKKKEPNIKPVKLIIPKTSEKIEVVTGKDKSVKPASCKGLGKYDGSQDWDEWIKAFNLYAMAGKWSEDLKISTFVDYLSNDIRIVLSNLPPEDFKNFEVLTHEVYDLFDKGRKSSVDYMTQLLNSTMKSTKSINVAQWYTKVVNLATLARVRKVQKNYQVKVVLIEGTRPAKLYEKVIEIFDIDDKDFIDNYTLDEIYKTILQKEKIYDKVRKVNEENSNKPNCPNPNTHNTPNNPKNKKNTPKPNEPPNRNTSGDKDKDPHPEKPIDKELMALTDSELKKLNRCYFCTKKLGDHLPRTCRAAYKGKKPEEIRKLYLEGKTPEINLNELLKSSEKTPKNTQVGLGDVSQKK
jgi:hypothetical protein